MERTLTHPPYQGSVYFPFEDLPGMWFIGFLQVIGSSDTDDERAGEDNQDAKLLHGIPAYMELQGGSGAETGQVVIYERSILLHRIGLVFSEVVFQDLDLILLGLGAI
ncbi:uncharacterized protein LOC120457506 [Drosophila santomea]|uniref:uncharacterized protein LOC120457506 n=1 Tax=Drosophila santomea TaxID=129105 RepID=UPI001953FC36|nr:uncharacterized protein LOC120457506 [Drosophila santomea]XP_039500994.1 uncharacterized protein LOC120457506 [Drosophila santomea]